MSGLRHSAPPGVFKKCSIKGLGAGSYTKMIGQHIGSYKIVRVLGEGGMGEAFK